MTRSRRPENSTVTSYGASSASTASNQNVGVSAYSIMLSTQPDPVCSPLDDVLPVGLSIAPELADRAVRRARRRLAATPALSACFATGVSLSPTASRSRDAPGERPGARPSSCPRRSGSWPERHRHPHSGMSGRPPGLHATQSRRHRAAPGAVHLEVRSHRADPPGPPLLSPAAAAVRRRRWPDPRPAALSVSYCRSDTRAMLPAHRRGAAARAVPPNV